MSNVRKKKYVWQKYVTIKQDHFNNKVCSVGESDRRRYVTQGNPLRPFEKGFKIGYFPKIYGDFYIFSWFSQDNESRIC